MGELNLKYRTLGGYIHSLSGLFITKDNPKGLTPKELKFLSALATIMDSHGASEVTREIKIELSNTFNQRLQVTTNYVNTLKNKGAITKDNQLHTVLTLKKVTLWRE